MHPIEPRIEHVVVLMLENRSFDCLLGKLYPKSDQFDGLEGSESNDWHKPDGTVEQVRVWNNVAMTADAVCLPDPEPGELFEDVNEQLFGVDMRPSRAARHERVRRQLRAPAVAVDARRPERDHALFRARLRCRSSAGWRCEFGVSDRWHASTPSETWPNRYFAHCGTAGGYVNNSLSRFPYQWPRMMPTIFRRLGKHGYSWKIYFHDIPQAVIAVRPLAQDPDPFLSVRGGIRAALPDRPAAELQLYRAALFSDAAVGQDAERPAPAAQSALWRAADRDRLQRGAQFAAMDSARC